MNTSRTAIEQIEKARHSHGQLTQHHLNPERIVAGLRRVHQPERFYGVQAGVLWLAVRA